MIGTKFNKLLVIEEVECKTKGHRSYKCKCECGNFTVALANNLKRGNTTQCKECAYAERRKKVTTVNINQNRALYSVFNSMKYRCRKDPKYTSRGITVCERWSDPTKGFSNFLEDMGERPEGASIDRINNDLGYYKENCRWTYDGVQNHNRSKQKNAETSKYIGVSFDPKGCKWVVQFTFEGKKTVARFIKEFDAAVHYDNLSEKYYNDRPNKTVKSEVEAAKRKSGGVYLCKKTNRYKVRVTVSSKRLSLGSYSSLDEAEKVLEDFKTSLI